MIYARSELLFPHRYVSSLSALRSAQWQALVRRVCVLPEDDEESLGFCYLLVNMCGCLNCDMNSYKASLGCSQCARRAITAFKGSDEELYAYFEQARDKVHAALSGDPDALDIK